MDFVTASPNPSTSDFDILFGKASGERTESVGVDLQGKILQRSPNPPGTKQTTINLGFYVDGMYIVQVNGNNKKRLLKVLKN